MNISKNIPAGYRQLSLPESVREHLGEWDFSNVLVPVCLGYYPSAHNHLVENEVPLEDYVLVCCTSGRGWYRIDEELHQVGPEQCFCLPAGRPHSYGADNDEPWTIYWVHFRGSLADAYARRINKVVDLQPELVSGVKSRINMFEEMYHTLDSGFSADSISYASACLHHFLGSISFISEYFKMNTLESKQMDRIEAAINFMEENIEKHYSIEQIASVSGYSPTRFSAVFKEQVGVSPIAYFNNLKIRYACKLLEHTDLKLNQLCYKIGISDCFYFSRLFSKTVGISPKFYRAKLRNVKRQESDSDR